ncbi:MAG: mannose-1-phosphate guanylyltransferase/mannose-6-phosphate isomerase [Alphaproteobacteria bacterium]|nr:mannose-1-phosphate guanylyltransferase/mannose-6-phosphate isomerase [Alphaproteobacteria bacterium]
MTKTVIPVILCGGSGTRLWPASREHHPKQFLPLIDDHSLLQNTMQRALQVSGCKSENIVTVTHSSLADQVKEQLSAIDPNTTQHILCEPSARNTSAAIAYAATYINRIFSKDTLMWVLPSDHHIGNEDELTAAFQHALRAGEEGYLVTFGIRPTRPETGYGYIRLGNSFSDGVIHHADAFVEKPNSATASSYIAAGNYMWNSGMFLFSAKTLLEEYKTHALDILEKVYLAMDNSVNPLEAEKDHYATIPKVPFDKTIMEKSSRVAIVPCDPAWSDIGSWESLWEIGKKDTDKNVIEGNAVCQNTRNCLIHAQKKIVACAGIENLVIIDTVDAILIANRNDSDSMRSLVKALKAAGHT